MSPLLSYYSVGVRPFTQATSPQISKTSPNPPLYKPADKKLETLFLNRNACLTKIWPGVWDSHPVGPLELVCSFFGIEIRRTKS